MAMIEITGTHPVTVTYGVDVNIKSSVKEPENAMQRKNKKTPGSRQKHPPQDEEEIPHFDEYA